MKKHVAIVGLLFISLSLQASIWSDIKKTVKKGADTVADTGYKALKTVKKGAKKGLGLVSEYNPVALTGSALTKATEELVQFAGTKLVLKDSPLFKDNPSKGKQANVRIGRELHQGERSYVQRRKAKNKNALEKLLGRPLNGDYVPTIATINSGGGTRSLISMIGFHIGAQNTGLFDAVTYDVGLSGGAWFVSMWQQSRKSIYDFKTEFKELVTDGLIGVGSKVLTERETKSVGESLIVRASLKQPITLVNIWGALLGARYLKPYGNKRQAVFFSELPKQENIDRYPFPVLTAVAGHDFDATKSERARIHWYEFTPYEVGGTGPWLGNVFAPLWSFGRKFKDGVSTNTNPEYDLGLLMGIWGSAFGVSAARVYEETLGNLGTLAKPVKFIINTLTDVLSISEKYEAEALGKAHNFTRGITQSPHKNDHKLFMCDAGVAFNLPYPPVSGHGARSADILIFFDASGGLPKTGAVDLQLAERYARVNNLKFPKLPTGKEFFRQTTKSIAIFKDESDPSVPLVIYFPLIMDRSTVTYGPSIPAKFKTDFSTMKFAYGPETVDRLSLVTQQNVEQNIEKVKEAIAWKIEQKGGFKEVQNR